MPWAWVHVPRTGGNTLERVIGRGSVVPGFGGFPYDGHATAVELRSRDPDRWDRCWTFGFCRDPFTRYLSLLKMHCGGTWPPSFDRWWKRWQPEYRPIWPAARFLDGVSHVYRFEELESAWADIGRRLDVIMPKQNDERVGAGTGLTPEIMREAWAAPGALEWVLQWAEDDFREFGYNRDWTVV